MILKIYNKMEKEKPDLEFEIIEKDKELTMEMVGHGVTTIEKNIFTNDGRL